MPDDASNTNCWSWCAGGHKVGDGCRVALGYLAVMAYDIYLVGRRSAVEGEAWQSIDIGRSFLDEQLVRTTLVVIEANMAKIEAADEQYRGEWFGHTAWCDRAHGDGSPCEDLLLHTEGDVEFRLEIEFQADEDPAGLMIEPVPHTISGGNTVDGVLGPLAVADLKTIQEVFSRALQMMTAADAEHADAALRDENQKPVTTLGDAEQRALEDLIRRTYHNLVADTATKRFYRLGDIIHLMDLRAALPARYGRADVDRALTLLSRHGDVYVWSGTSDLTPQVKDAALWFGGQYNQVMQIEADKTNAYTGWRERLQGGTDRESADSMTSALPDDMTEPIAKHMGVWYETAQPLDPDVWRCLIADKAVALHNEWLATVHS